jgi:O-antigen ligase
MIGTRPEWFASRRWIHGGSGSPTLAASVAFACIAGLAAAAIVALFGPTVAILLVVGVACVGAAVAMPGVLLAAYLLIPFYKGAVQPFLPIDITVILAAANALQLVPVVLGSHPRRIPWPGVALWFGIATLVLAGTLWASDQGLALSTAVTFWLLVCLPLLAAALRVGSDPRYVRQLLWAFFVMGVITAVLGLVNLSTADRLVILGMNTIQVSVAACLVPLVGVAFVLREDLGPVRAMTIVLIPVAFVVAIASGSRGPLLLILLIAVVALARRLLGPGGVSPRVVAAAGGTLLAAALILSLSSAFLPALSIQRFTLFGDFVASLLSGSSTTAPGDTSSADRLRLYGIAVAIFSDHPILGSGPAGFEVLSPSYAGSGGGDRYPHDSVLQFAAEFGIVGVLAFLSLIGATLARRAPPDSVWTAVRVILVFVLLNSLISGDILEDRLLWGLMALVLLAPVDARPAVPAPVGEESAPRPSAPRGRARRTAA